MPKVQKLIAVAVDDHGSQAKLATALGCSQQQVSLLLRGKIGVTAEMAMKLHAATNGKVSKHQLRPDIFGPAAPETERAA